MRVRGGSNGGLLMGVEFEQHPELWDAVIIQVPLLDMLRFEKIAAGASWVGEYGSVSNPAERAFLAGISPYNNLKAGVKYPTPFLYYEAIEGGHAEDANLREDALEDALEMTLTYLSRGLMPN